jgi:hypothetical protein
VSGLRLPDDVLAGLWRAVAHVAQQRLVVVERALQALLDVDVDVDAHRAAGVEEAHKLVGSLDSYGRTGGSALALRAATLLEGPTPDLPELSSVLQALRRTVDGPT